MEELLNPVYWLLGFAALVAAITLTGVFGIAAHFIGILSMEGISGFTEGVNGFQKAFVSGKTKHPYLMAWLWLLALRIAFYLVFELFRHMMVESSGVAEGAASQISCALIRIAVHYLISYYLFRFAVGFYVLRGRGDSVEVQADYPYLRAWIIYTVISFVMWWISGWIVGLLSIIIVTPVIAIVIELVRSVADFLVFEHVVRSNEPMEQPASVI